ncbi:hypothetical protein BDR03DRAFT_1018636 [Suillus americanus]|nr:hypothetical protein BDR03DRAFT_1018636 [Suillus americanus]
MPAHFADFLPGSATHLAHMPPTACQQRGHAIADQTLGDQPDSPLHIPSPEPSEHNVTPPLSIPFQMEANNAGLYHIYITHPTILPNHNTLGAVTNVPMLAGDDQIPKSSWVTEGLLAKGTEELFEVFSNPISGLLLAYQYSGTGQQSVAELQRLMTFVGDPLLRHANALLFSHTQCRDHIYCGLGWAEFP